jgi:hypothetical protein
MGNSMERLVGEYLDSMVGGNPVLRKEKVIDRYWSSKHPVENFYVNGVKVGMVKFRDNGVSMEYAIRVSIMELFDLNIKDTYLYFREWVNKLDNK